MHTHMCMHTYIHVYAHMYMTVHDIKKFAAQSLVMPISAARVECRGVLFQEAHTGALTTRDFQFLFFIFLRKLSIISFDIVGP